MDFKHSPNPEAQSGDHLGAIDTNWPMERPEYKRDVPRYTHEIYPIYVPDIPIYQIYLTYIVQDNFLLKNVMI